MIEDLLDDHTPTVVALTRQLRDLVRSAIPDAVEKVYLGWHGLGYHHPTAGYLCAIFPDVDYVRVGFEHGHLLPDPGGLFDSGGRQVRYVTVGELTPEVSEGLRELIDHAIHLRV